MIVINARFLAQERRGVQRFAEEIGAELKRRRNDVVFVAPHGVRLQDSALALDVRRIGLNRGALWEQLDLPLWLARHGRPLLLSLGNTGPLAYGNQLLALHDLAHIHYPRGHRRATRLGLRLLTPPLLQRVRGLLTISDFSRQQIAAHYDYPAQHIRVVPGAATRCFQPAANDPQDQPPYLLAVCSTRAHKNLERTLQAFLSLQGAEDAELRIVTGEIRTLSTPSFIPLAHPRIQLLGRLSDEQLLEQYRGARALVVPSLYEGFGLPALEAQASGCPVIAASTPALLETLGDSALFFDPQDVSNIAQCMRRVLSEPTLRAQLRTRGLTNTRRFSWQDAGGRLSRLLDEALSQAPRPAPGLPASGH